jgi:hypothetical protein
LAERQRVEALLHSEFGLQRLSRARQNYFNRVTLIPRESTQHDVIAWRDGEFRIESSTHRDAPEPVTRLTSGDRFVVGSTDVRFECTTQKWQVDLERERALLARDDATAWIVYGDELQAAGDPLGLVLAGTPEFDVSFEVEVRPLLAAGQLAVVPDARGLWREVTFIRDYEHGEFDEGIIGAVLLQSVAWFAQRVRVEFRPGRGASRQYRRLIVQGAAELIGRFASPHLQAVSLPNVPEGEPLPRIREGVTVDRRPR